MSVHYQGKVSVGVAIPALASALLALDIDGMKAELQGLITLAATITPPSIKGVAEFIAGLQAALSAGFQPPSINLQLDVLAKIGLLKLRLEAALALVQLVAEGGVRLYEVDGKAVDFGPSMAAELAGTGGGAVPAGAEIFGVVLLGDVAATIKTLKTLRGHLE